ncbi:MAG: hypothetical protein QM817_41760 [Archangium sp.]
MMRLAGTLATIAMVVGGCNCPGPTPDCTDTTIAFETPTSGMMVDAPFEVSVNVKNADGSAFNIDAATLSVGGMSFTGTVSGNRATFTGVTAAAGEQTLSVSVARDTCSKTVTSTVTVRDTCTAPAVTAVTFPQDTGAPLGVLNNAEIPQGTNLRVKVDATCVSGVQVRIKRGTTTVGGPVDFVNGTVTLTLATLPDSDSARYDLFAELVRSGTAVNTPTGNPQASASIQVSRAAPTVTLTTPASYGPMDDADSATGGFQARVTGTAPANTSCTLTVTGQTPQTVTPSMTGDVSADFTLTSGSYMATLTCTDGSGNTGTAMSTFTVDFDPPTVVITSPANVDGGATMVVTQSPVDVTVSTTGAENGSTVLVFRNGMQVGSGTVMNNMATVAVPFGVDGTYTVEVRVTDLAGNTGSASITVVVALSGCGAQFTRPMACPTLLTPAQLSSGAYSFQTTSNAVCSGQPAALFRTDLLADGGMTAEVAAGTTTLTGAGVAAFSPLTLASGDYVFRAAVTNPNDGGTSEATCAVTVDLDGPAITAPLPLSGQTQVILGAAQDGQPGTPGVQRQLSFTARVPVGGEVFVCTTQQIDPASGMQRMQGPCGSGWFQMAQGVTSPANGFTFPNGSYQLKVVVVASGVSPSPESAPISVVADADRPCVSSTNPRLPQDANADGRLNIAELNGGLPTLEFGLGCMDTPATLAAMNAVVVRDVSGAVLGSVRPSSATFASGRYTVTLTGPYTTETSLHVFVELTDLVGNRNLYAVNDPGEFQFSIDPVAPTCDITSPAAGQTLVGTAAAPGGMFGVSVSTSADVGTNGVRVTFGATAPRDLTPTANVAQTSYAVTGTNAYAVTATCTDPAGNATAATTRNLTIDLDAPTCNLTSPTAMTYNVNQIATNVTVGGADGQPVTIRSSAQGAPLTTNLLVSGGTAMTTLSYPNGTQNVTAEVRDPAGNLCTSTVNNVVVNSTACALALNVFPAAGGAVLNAAGNWFNRSNTGNLTATTGRIATVTANSADCRAGQTVTLQRTAPTMGTAVMSTTATTGDVSFTNVDVVDGETWTMTINNGTGLLTTQTFRVGLRVPTATGVTVNSFTVTNAQPLFFVAPTGNINLEPAAGTIKSTTYFADQAAGTPGAQVQVAVTGINGARYGSDNGTISVLYGVGTLTSSATGTEPFDFPATSVTLTHSTTGNFIVRVTSAAGNSADIVTNASTVDVLAPSVPSVTPTLTSTRAATLTLSWAPVVDDASDLGSGGLTGGPPSQLAGYDIRWTTTSVPGNASMGSVTEYFGSVSRPEGIEPWSASTINRPITVPPLNGYFVAVRARDEVGNYSTFAAPTVQNNFWGGTSSTGSVTLSGVASSAFGQTLALGRLNNDTVNDLVVAAPNRATNIGSVYVYWGGAGFATQATCTAPACQEIQPPDGLSGLFGTDVSVGNVGDSAAEGVEDLLIAQPTFSSASTGRAFIFFGTTGASINTATFIEIRGAANSNFASSARIIPSIDGDTLSEIVFSAHGFGGGQGRVFIFKGRTVAAWQSLQTSSGGTIPMTAADWVIDGATTIATNGNQFGRQRWGLQGLGDLNGDGRPEFSVPVSKETDGAASPSPLQKLYIFSGAAVSAATMPIPASSALNVLTPPNTVGTSASFDAFSRSVVGNLDVVSDTSRDLIVAYPQQSRIHIYTSPLTVAPNAASFELISGPQLFGFVTTAGDVTGDGKIDILAGEVPTGFGRAWLLSQRPGVTAFDTAITIVPNFFVSELRVSTAATRFGRVTLVGDLTGDGSPEVIVADDGLNNVQVWK